MARFTPLRLDHIVQFRTTTEAREMLAAAAAHLDRSESDVVRNALDYYFDHAPEMSNFSGAEGSEAATGRPSASSANVKAKSKPRSSSRTKHSSH